jgi:hypothetical protein
LKSLVAIFFIGFFLCPVSTAIAQQKNKNKKLFQFSALPALGTNGLHPGGFTNAISINLLSGYSKENLLLEIGGVSNLNLEKTSGLQIAGVANITGANAFAGMTPKEKELKIKSGFEANLDGVQLSGLTNVVLTNVFGGQLTGGINISKGALIGLQLAGISNTVYKYSFGLQLAGLWNVSVESMDGVQVAAVSNYTKGGLYGLQLAAFNQAGFIEGVNSYKNDSPTGVQIGLVNKASKMNGFQIGIINIARRNQGTQIGLINVYRNGKDIDTRDGTAIGLINWGNVGYVSAYSSETFIQNYELSTGTFYKNSRIKEERFGKTLQNALIYSRGSWDGKPMWAIGYGLKKMYFNRSDIPGMTAFRFFGYGVDLLHVSRQQSIEKNVSALSKVKILAGTRLSSKLTGVYVFATIAANYYVSSRGGGISTLLVSEANTDDPVKTWWPGGSLGVMLR